MIKKYVRHEDIFVWAGTFLAGLDFRKPVNLYGVPRGGACLLSCVMQRAYMMGLNTVLVTDNPKQATHIIDDIVDSGATRERYKIISPSASFHSLYDKTSGGSVSDRWLVFPWEDGETPAVDNVTRILQSLNQDVEREGLKDTPKRVVKFYEEFLTTPAPNLTTFESETYDEMITQKEIPFYSLCEHHLLPFFGTVAIGYIPNKKVVGLSKLARTVDHFSHRLTMQERMTADIARFLSDGLSTESVAVTVRAEHLCMTMRGVQKHGTLTETQVLLGAFRNDDKARHEYLLAVK